VNAEQASKRNQIRTLASEHEQVSREGVLLQHPLDKHTEPVDALPEIGVAKRQVCLNRL
jgi:hypothetical protein